MLEGREKNNSIPCGCQNDFLTLTLMIQNKPPVLSLEQLMQSLTTLLVTLHMHAHPMHRATSWSVLEAADTFACDSVHGAFDGAAAGTAHDGADDRVADTVVC